jgi:DAK2 domain fusion protein YloV
VAAKRASSAPAADQKWLGCNGHQFRRLFRAGLGWLEKNHQHVNALNVFPVPDGDTGTNMLLTMRSAYGRIQNSEEIHAGRVAHEVSQGALMGARGNSGVILSQIWRGLAKSLRDNESFNARELATAMNEAADTAYKGVMRPVEGTILTVMREMAAEARDAARKSQDLRFLLERSLERGQQALARTPEQLPVLKQAGVVDSGGQGLIYIFEGMLRDVYGEMIDVVYAKAMSSLPAQYHVAPEDGLEFPYDVQFILLGKGLDVSAIRESINAMGDSTLVVGDDTTIKVHVHVKDPGVPISFGISLGVVTDVVVENMQLQMENIIAPARGAENGAPEIPIQPGQLAVVAVAAGDGLAEVFRSLGAAGIVNGGQSNNPSTEEILRAIEEVPTDKVIVLPNNKNIILTAEAARDLTAKEVVVVPTRSVPQGISALCALNPLGELAATAATMREAYGEVVSAEIARATRSVTLDGVTVAAGEMISVVNGKLCVAGHELEDVLTETLEKMGAADRELVTVYYGQDIDSATAGNVRQQILELYPELEVEIVAGGQPHYQYILGAE